MGRRFLSNIDWPLAFFTTVITIIGLANLYSATYGLPVAKYFNSQLLWVGIGLAVMMFVALIDYRYLDRFAYALYFITVALLFLVLMTGTKVSGSVRWLKFAGLTIQPSEMMKIVIIIMLAKIFKQREYSPPYNFWQLLFPFFMLLLPMVLINLQPDLGTTLALGITGFTIIFFVGIQRKTIVGLFTAVALSIPIAWFFVLSTYQKGRVITFLQPEKYHLGGGYQVIQSKIAVGSGLITGKGFLHGTQSKLMFLPKQYTDFVFSNFAEEWGFLGSSVLIFCFVMFVLAGLNVAQHAKDRYGTLLAIGLTAYFFWHFLINIGMELGLLPVVGLPLPFLSYGGSVTITSFVAVGLLMNVSIRRFLF